MKKKIYINSSNTSQEAKDNHTMSKKSRFLTLIPLGYLEDLSPLGGGGGHFGPPPSDLGN